jgi:hypothetical protein
MQVPAEAGPYWALSPLGSERLDTGSPPEYPQTRLSKAVCTKRFVHCCAPF